MTAYDGFGGATMSFGVLIPLTLSLVASLGQTTARPDALISTLPRVYVTTAPSGAPSELADRQQSVKDLRKALEGKKKVLVLVDTEERAEITVDVVSRATTVPKVRIGLATPGQAGPAREVRLRVKIVRGEADPITFTNKNSAFDVNRGWQSAAEDIAKQIEKWIAGQKDAR